MEIAQMQSHLATDEVCAQCDCEIVLVLTDDGWEAAVECDCVGSSSALCA